MTNLIINGRVASKKNSKRIIKRGGRTFLIPSTAYEKYKADAISQLKKQTFDFYTEKIKVKYVFFLKGKLRIDLDNAIASINDILQDAKIIIDDDNILELHAKKINGCEKCLTQISIYV